MQTALQYFFSYLPMSTSRAYVFLVGYGLLCPIDILKTTLLYENNNHQIPQ